MRKFNTRMLEFASMCRYKLRAKETQQNGTLASRWSMGVFIGVCSMTGQYIVFDGHEVAYSRTVVQVPDQQKWSMENISNVNVRPFQLHVPKEPRVIFKDPSKEDEVAKR